MLVGLNHVEAGQRIRFEAWICFLSFADQEGITFVNALFPDIDRTFTVKCLTKKGKIRVNLTDNGVACHFNHNALDLPFLN